MQKIIITLFFLFVGVSFSQAETCTISGTEAGSTKGFYLVQAGDKTYRAFSEENYEKLKSTVKKDAGIIKKLQKQLVNTGRVGKDYVKLTDEYAQLRKAYAALTAKYNKTFSDSVSLIENYKKSTEKSLELNDKYNQLAQNFDDLAGKYRTVAVDKTSFINFDIGVGATTNNGDTEAAVLLGVGISKIKLWGFFQNNNSGALIGTSFNF